MNQTKIEWTDMTWNPVTGCSPVSEGCRNCYAKRMAIRLRGRCGYPADDPFRVTFHPERLNEPFKIKTPKRIFVCSMGDLFHKEVNWQWYGEIFRVIRETPHHTYIILTKRPFIAGRQFNLELMLSGRYLCDIPFSNVQLGVSCSNQSDIDKFVPALLQIPAAKRILSLEPLLGPVHIAKYMPQCTFRPIACDRCHDCDPCSYTNSQQGRLLDEVICGGETGPGARPMHPDWVRKIRDDCQAAGVPFFFKQWGPTKASGRLLDGRTWDELA